MSRPTMSCRELVSLVTEYLEGVLPPIERLRFERHVAICPPCRGYLTQMRETINASGGLTEETISPDARDALLEAFSDWRRKGRRLTSSSASVRGGFTAASPGRCRAPTTPGTGSR